MNTPNCHKKFACTLKNMSEPALVPRALSEEQVYEIRQAFDLFDIDGTGRIDPSEVQLALNTFGYEGVREDIKRIIEKLGNVKKPSIDFTEFLKLVNSTLQGRDPLEEIDKAFARFDDDSTDRISFRNLKRVSLELGEQLTDDELHEMIKAADEDGDGEIGRDEFMRLMQRAHVF